MKVFRSSDFLVLIRLIERLERAFGLTADLYSSLDESKLTWRCANLPSNSFGKQAWCIIGARESYFRAMKLGKWSGFSCSLNDVNEKTQVISRLRATSKEIIDFIRTKEDTKECFGFMLDVLEHEIQHHGQLIRYIYGNKLKFPESWNKRYTV